MTTSLQSESVVKVKGRGHKSSRADSVSYGWAFRRSLYEKRRNLRSKKSRIEERHRTFNRISQICRIVSDTIGNCSLYYLTYPIVVSYAERTLPLLSRQTGETSQVYSYFSCLGRMSIPFFVSWTNVEVSHSYIDTNAMKLRCQVLSVRWRRMEK